LDLTAGLDPSLD